MNEFHLGEPIGYIKNENEKDLAVIQKCGLGVYGLDAKLLSYDSSFFVFGKYTLYLYILL